MTSAVITEYWRSGRDRYRIQIWPDPDCESPRASSNGSLLWTWESKFCSPDSRSSVDVPDYLNAAIERWCGHNDYSRPVNAAALVRYCRAYLQDRVYAVGGLQRSVNDELMVDWSPEPGVRYDGLGLVVSGAWEQVMGTERPLAIQAAALLEQELDTYNRWGRGECYGYVVKRAVPGWVGLPEGSRWGYAEEPDGHPLEEARRCLPDGAERIDALPAETERIEQIQRLVGAVDQQLVDTVEQAVVKARAAAGGDSNDEEIEALQQALECALVRWPEVSHNEEDV